MVSQFRSFVGRIRLKAVIRQPGHSSWRVTALARLIQSSLGAMRKGVQNLILSPVKTTSGEPDARNLHNTPELGVSIIPSLRSWRLCGFLVFPLRPLRLCGEPFAGRYPQRPDIVRACTGST